MILSLFQINLTQRDVAVLARSDPANHARPLPSMDGQFAGCMARAVAHHLERRMATGKTGGSRKKL
jgi:hypothetical protein